MKIALLTGQWLRTKGGPTNYVVNLARALENQGAKVTVLAAEPGAGATQYRSSPLGRNLDIIRILSELRPDIIHIHSRLHLIPPALAYRTLAGSRCPLVFTFHTQPSIRRYLEVSAPIPPSYGGIRGKLARILLRRCDAVAAVSDSIIRDLNAHFGMAIEKYSVIPSGSGSVDPDLAKLAELRAAHNLSGLKPVLATVGVCSWDWKAAGHQVAIESVGHLRGKYPNIGLIIAGDGQYREYLANLVRHLGLEKNVRFLGNVDRANEVLAAADLYVHMAMNEGSPLAVVEAMAAGKPIIAANLGGIPELIEDGVTGRLIDPNVGSLAQAAEGLISDRELAERLGKNAMRVAKSELTWDAVARSYSDLYRSLAPSGAAMPVSHAVTQG